MTNDITVLLPDGRKLVAYDKKDADCPGIAIEIIDVDGHKHDAACVDYLSLSDDCETDQRLRLLLWNSQDEIPAVVMQYDTGDIEEIE